MIRDGASTIHTNDGDGRVRNIGISCAASGSVDALRFPHDECVGGFKRSHAAVKFALDSVYIEIVERAKREKIENVHTAILMISRHLLDVRATPRSRCPLLMPCGYRALAHACSQPLCSYFVLA